MSFGDDLLSALSTFVNIVKRKLSTAIEEVSEDALDILIQSLFDSFHLKDVLEHEWDHLKDELKKRFLSSLEKFNKYIIGQQLIDKVATCNVRTLMEKGGIPRQLLKNVFTIKRVLEGNLRDYSV